MSEKEGPGTKWIESQGLDTRAYEALLKHFGLEDYKDELPLGKVITTGPFKLGKIRRKKEKLHGLERKEIVSQTLGNDTRIP